MAVIERYHPAELNVLCTQLRASLQEGGLVAIPTETYYGLGADPFNHGALERLVRVKGRSDRKPILCLIGAREQLSDFAEQIPPAAAVLMECFWPGPLTIVFPARAGMSEILTAGTGTVGVRWTSSTALAAILQRVGPLTGTSANHAGEPPFRTAEDVQQTLGKDIDVIVDAGTTPGGLPSTVIQVQEDIHIIREGAIARALLRQVLDSRGFCLKHE